MGEPYRIPRRFTCAATSWSVAVCLGVAHSLKMVDGLLIWAMLACTSALVFTGWLLLEHVADRAVQRVLETQEQLIRRVLTELISHHDNHLDDVAERLADAMEEANGVVRLR